MTTLNPQDLVEFNINKDAYGQITDEGWKHLENTVGEDYIKNCIKPRAVEINGEVWYKLQLWDWFALFPVKNGVRLLFGTRILFKKSDFNSL